MYQFKKYNVEGETIKKVLGFFLLGIVACAIVYGIFSFSHILGYVFGLFTMGYVGAELIGAFSHSNYDWILRIFVLVTGYVLLPVNIFMYNLDVSSFYVLFGITLVVWGISLILIIVNRYFHKRNKY